MPSITNSSPRARTDGVTIVIPVRNGERWLAAVLDAILAQRAERPFEVLVIDDGSTDGSRAVLERYGSTDIGVVDGPARGAAAAMNAGIRLARFPFIAQIDQDVVVEPGWLDTLLDAMTDADVAAAQGYYYTDPQAPLASRVMGLDLEQRYAAIDGADTDHVCTGNAVYRASALHAVGLFDENLGYGYDNDISYRLGERGYRLVLCRDARSRHFWRSGIVPYLMQQYGFGYGRLDLVVRHRRRLLGDAVSPPEMMLHPMLLLAAIAIPAGGALTGYADVAALVAGLIVSGLLFERFVAGCRAAVIHRDIAGLAFPVLHLARDAAWIVAIVMWSARWIGSRPTEPSFSMNPRPTGFGWRIARFGLRPSTRPGHPELVERLMADCGSTTTPPRFLVLIPAHNEAASLPAVIGELRAVVPEAELLVVDDGSSDGTWRLAKALGVRWLRLHERVGVGSAVRAGLRYAAALGYQIVVRVDGDGQHHPEAIPSLVAPLHADRADIVLGSRFTAEAGRRAGIVRRLLAACLTTLTGRSVTDPTTGFCAFGPRAIEMLCEHHPSGYAEAELLLFSSRNGLRADEVPVGVRNRVAGSTTLTPSRRLAASARIALAMVVVPLRGVVRSGQP